VRDRSPRADINTLRDHHTFCAPDPNLPHGQGGTLAQTLGTTNPMESTIDIVRTHARNVKRWRDGDMRLRWAAAGMLAPSSNTDA